MLDLVDCCLGNRQGLGNWQLHMLLLLRGAALKGLGHSKIDLEREDYDSEEKLVEDEDDKSCTRW